MTKEDFLNNATGNISSREEGIDILEKHVYPFEMLVDYFVPNNMTQEEFSKLIEIMSVHVFEQQTL